MKNAFGMTRSERGPIINITSLIDVMFLLLIFFMVSSTFREHLGIDLSLPEAKTAQNLDVKQNEITVTAEGEYLFGEQKVDEAGLRSALETLVAEAPDASVTLRADERADFGRVVRAMDIARDVGGTQLIIPTDYPKDPPTK